MNKKVYTEENEKKEDLEGIKGEIINEITHVIKKWSYKYKDEICPRSEIEDILRCFLEDYFHLEKDMKKRKNEIEIFLRIFINTCQLETMSGPHFNNLTGQLEKMVGPFENHLQFLLDIENEGDTNE